MNLLDIPLEINYLASLHPYYQVNGYCNTSKFTVQECENRKYETLQIWVESDKSINELREMYPNISLKQVVELSLIYHPLIEMFIPGTLKTNLSIPTADHMILLYACRDRNLEVVKHWIDISTQYYRNLKIPISETVLIPICFYYEYIEPLTYMITRLNEISSQYPEAKERIDSQANRYRAHIEIIRLKLDPTYKPQIQQYTKRGEDKSSLWSPELYAEYLVLYSIVAKSPQGLNMLTGATKRHGSRTNLGLFVNYIGVDKLKSILRRYFPNKNFDINVDTTSKGQLVLFEMLPGMNLGKLLKQPELAPEYITETNIPINDWNIRADLSAYYLLSGQYNYYVSEQLKNPHELERKKYLAGTDILDKYMTYELYYGPTLITIRSTRGDLWDELVKYTPYMPGEEWSGVASEEEL